MTKQVMVCSATQNVFKNSAMRASVRVNMGTSGRSSSVAPIKCPVARAQIFSSPFTLGFPIVELPKRNSLLGAVVGAQ